MDESAETRNGRRGRVAGKVAVVVGAGQTPGGALGNGRAAALVYAREGAKVLAADRDLAAAQETVELIESEGGEAFAVEVDVLDEAQIVAMVEAATRRWQRLDILHNNVGVSSGIGDAPVTEITPEAFSFACDLNIRGMVLACKHAIPVMREAGRGAIVNISSIAARVGYPRVGYKTTKTAVLALTEHLALAYGPDGIRVNAVLPGRIDTPMAIELNLTDGVTREERVAERQASTPLDRPGTAWDVAQAALYLASDDAAYVTGVSLPVDGGVILTAG